MDSGSGGLTVWSEVVKLLPNESTIYLGDHAWLPYGQRKASEIKRRVIKIIKFFVSQQVKLMVIACNTATVVGIEEYRQRFPKLPIIGIVPVVKTAAQKSRIGSLAILSTRYTANSDYQKKLIREFTKGVRVYNLFSDQLVPLIENGDLVAAEKELREILTPLDKQIDVLALGCTHYPFLLPKIQSILGKKVTVLDSGQAVARHVQRILLANSITADQTNVKYLFFTTGNQANF